MFVPGQKPLNPTENAFGLLKTSMKGNKSSRNGRKVKVLVCIGRGSPGKIPEDVYAKAKRGATVTTHLTLFIYATAYYIIKAISRMSVNICRCKYLSNKAGIPLPGLYAKNGVTYRHCIVHLPYTVHHESAKHSMLFACGGK